ncbi:Acriflavin resistance protein [Rhodopirellula europaea SH398]|uniref:Acriflavin resistance protein n=2 Tax=Rhodopirellula TaxID=265488 RepID=M5RY73_9BACT|nr:Acriflavin resistance protein [Rhodopirellula europaea SH398]
MLVVVISLVVLVYGSYLATQMSIDVFPDLDRPRVVIITEASGLATEEVETLVTQPIEIALMGANGVQAVRSQSTSGLNIIFVEFDWSTEIRAARQTVQERLTTLEGILPAGIRPQMTPPSSIMGQIVVAGIYRQDGPDGGKLAQVGTTNLMAEMTVADGQTPHIEVWRPGDRHDFATWEKLATQSIDWSAAEEPNVGTATIEIDGRTYEANFYSDAKQQLELRTIADWIIRPRLLKTTGVAEVFMQGGDRKQYQILIDPTALLEYDITVQDVEKALRESAISIPKPNSLAA